jgi:Do/DeqQ family serine protease
MLNVLLLLVAVIAAVPAQGETQRAVPATREAIQLSFAPVVRKVAPAVVNITSRKAVAVQRNPFLDDPFFQFFFRDFGRARPEQRVQQSLGSGVIVARDGLIVTNHHVVEGADEIEVVLADRRSFEARLVASDERADLAFLRVDPGPEGLPVLSLSDSDAIEVGDLVLAVGNPFGIGQTVTSGIVSAKARTAPQLDRDVSFIQTDAAINPGNSGGALVDMQGRLIGINTAIFSRSGGSIGIGFAVPANLLQARIRGLDGGGGGKPLRPWIGARLQAVDAPIAASLGLDRPSGVLIADLYPRAAADRAGLRTGDVVMTVDGAEVVDPQGLGYRLSLHAAGERATLGVWRKGKMLSVRLPVEAAPETPAADLTRLDRSTDLDGAVIANLSPALNETLGVDPFERGVAVLEVRPGTRAQLWRLRPGDIVEAVNGRPVSTVAELRRSLRTGLRRLDLRRDGRRLTVTADG